MALIWIVWHSNYSWADVSIKYFHIYVENKLTAAYPVLLILLWKPNSCTNYVAWGCCLDNRPHAGKIAWTTGRMLDKLLVKRWKLCTHISDIWKSAEHVYILKFRLHKLILEVLPEPCPTDDVMCKDEMSRRCNVERWNFEKVYSLKTIFMKAYAS